MTYPGFLSVNGAHEDKFRKHLTEPETQKQLAEIMNDAIIDRILAFNIDLQIIAWNRMCEIVTGISKHDAIGKCFFDVLPGTDACPYVGNAITMALKGFQMFIPSDQGSYGGGYYEHHFIPLKNERGHVIGVLNIIHDVAHRVKTEEELKALNKALARKNRELKQKKADLMVYADVTAHDLKEPLWRIYSFIEKLTASEMENLSEEGKMNFKRIQASARRMMLLTDDVLKYFDLQMQARSASPIDLGQLMKFALNELDEPLKDSRAVVNVGEMPVITGYRNLLTQMFKNIIDNAIKFQPTGNVPQIEISASNIKGSEIKHHEANKETEYVCVSITDNGIGFSKKHSDRIFQMFQRVHHDPEYPGTGVGLAISKKIAALHSGFITAGSRPGEGSTFNCYLELK
ncbi:MAG: hypothetical protein EOP56_17365 [Sphingobacteriales bacterium]|nr:MAG: hypothetical protein EOP56_17365 [Sphingobacteriales bacterium]